MRRCFRGLCVIGVLGLTAVWSSGCGTPEKKDAADTRMPMAPKQMADARAMAIIAPSRAATTRPTLNSVRGTVTFSQYGDEVEVTATIEGLTPGSVHGFHIHEKGDISSADLLSTGNHWNPSGDGMHGAPGEPMAHAGDLGNVTADANGVARLSIRTKSFSLTKEPLAVGKAVIVHAGVDDLKSQPAGNAGARVAGGVIVSSRP